MDIQSIRKIIFPAVSSAISKLEEENHEIKLTMLRGVFNEAINGALNISHTDNSSIKAKFSGRGKAWAKINVDESCNVWLKLKSHLTVDVNNINFEKYSSLLDLFISNGFGWVRYSGSNLKTTIFKIRYLGSKNIEGINLKLNNEIAANLENLEGVPHKLGLEDGISEKVNIKQKIEVEVSKKELETFGIQTIESFLKDEE